MWPKQPRQGLRWWGTRIKLLKFVLEVGLSALRLGQEDDIAYCTKGRERIQHQFFIQHGGMRILNGWLKKAEELEKRKVELFRYVYTSSTGYKNKIHWTICSEPWVPSLKKPRYVKADIRMRLRWMGAGLREKRRRKKMLERLIERSW